MKHFTLLFIINIIILVGAKTTIAQDTNKDGYHDDDVEVLKNILKNNNAEGELDWEGSDYSSYSGITWNDNTPKRIMEIEIAFKSLNGYLKLSSCTELIILNCRNNNISDLDISNCTLLTSLNCYNNKIIDLDISNCTLLTSLNCYNNKIIDLDISNCTLLTSLDYRNNKINNLDISNHLRLKRLDCSNNNINTLDISNHSRLEILYCDNNRINKLNISNCTQLERLSCRNNNISKLDFSNCTLLESIDCDNNKISKFDISNCTQLINLSINFNKLSFSELSKISFDGFNYHSRKKIFEKEENFTIPKTIDFSSEEIINGKNSNFKWFKDRKLLKGINSSRYTASDFGNYYCIITNSEFPDLTLVTNKITIQKNEHAPSFTDQEFVLIKGNKSGSFIGSVIINDNDSPKNFIHYKINDNNIFIINAETGEITIRDASSIDYDKVNTLKIIITINDNKHKATSKEFTIKIVDKDSNKDGYNDEDVEVLKNILRNNNAKGKLDWKGSDYSSYSGITWNDNIPKRISKIKISSKSLNGNLNIGSCTELISLDLSFNNISILDISNCSLLTSLNCRGNIISELDISNCSLLTSLNCQNNKISDLDISNCSILTSLECRKNTIRDLNISNCSILSNLNCYNNEISDLNISSCTLLKRVFIDLNKLSFSELSKISLDRFNYHSNKKVFEKEEYFTIPQTIDFSSEEVINGKKSDFKWFKNGKLLKGINSSRYTATDFGNYYCSITNSEFPDLTLITNRITIQKNEHAPSFSDQEFVLIKGNSSGSFIGSVIINDKDSPKNIIHYEINNNNNFMIDKNTGKITIRDASSIDYDNTNTIKITITINDNKHEAISKNYTIKIVYKDSNKDGYHDDDVEVLKNILKNNNAKGKLDWEGTDYSSYTGITWNDNTPKRITKIDIHSKSLNGDLHIGSCTELTNLGCQNNNLSKLDIANCTLLTRIYCANNDIRTLDISNCTLLTNLFCGNNDIRTLDIANCSLLTNLFCGNNDISTLDIANCSLLTSLDCGNNNISKLDIASCTLLKHVSINSNKLYFSELSKISIAGFNYKSNKKIFEKEEYFTIPKTIDFSSEEIINGKNSDFKWFKDGKLLTGKNSSIYTAIDFGNYYCIITNSEFPDLTLVTNTITIQKNEHAPSFSDQEFVLIKGNKNGTIIGSLIINDKDSPKNFIHYEINNNNFIIDEKTGEIIIRDASSIDHENANTLKITITIKDNKHEAISKEFTIKIVDKDINKDGYHDQDVEVLKNILKNNNTKGKLDWEGTDYSSYTGITWNDNIPKRITSIDISDTSLNGNLKLSFCTKLTFLSCNTNNIDKLNIDNCSLLTKLYCQENNISTIDVSNCRLLTRLDCSRNKISELDISNCSLLTSLNCSDNKIRDLDISNCSLLTSLNCSDNKISEIDISNCSLLTSLTCSDNKISDLDISNCPILTELDCDSNKLSFSELSKINVDGFNYHSSKKIFEEKEYFTIPQTIDFSSEEIINSKNSDFKWFKDGKLLKGINSSKYTASDFGNYYCSITNSEFPDLTLVTNKIIIQKNEYAPIFSDQEFVLIKGNKSGTIIGSVIINDKDKPKNLIHYEIKENNNFIIDEKTGDIIIRNASSIDYENTNTINITITIKDNKYEAISKEFTIKIVDKDSNKDGYHDQDVEVLKNILINNNAEGELDWEGTDYSSYSGITWNDNTPKRIISIYMYNKSLIGNVDVSNCLLLTYINLNKNKINSLDISNCSLLTFLDCGTNNINSLDVSNCSLLTSLDCRTNNINSLDVSNCSLLTSLDCGTNNINSLDVSNCSLLTSLDCDRNNINNLNLSNCSLLTSLDCSRNNINNLNLSNCSLLTHLSYNNNNISSLDISNCTLLTSLNCNNNKISELNISNSPLLTTLSCENNKISDLDASNSPLLKSLNCNNNNISILNASNCTLLTTLSCYNNKISELNISNCALLITLSCNNNKISELNISNSPLLTTLSCYNNKISELNISNSTLLTTLSCYNNKISELNISNSPLLKILTCYNNNISKIDISNCTQLTNVSINSNKLSFSELSKINLGGFNYHSSKKIFEQKEYCTIPQTIDFSSEAIINGKKSDFKWFKDGKLLKGINSSRYTASDFGNYYCSITNSEFLNLTLVTSTISIQKNEYAPSFSDQEFVLIKSNKNGTIIGSVIINDKDKHKNFIHYEINDNNIFIINAETGEIIIRNTSSIDYENANTIKITITINDNKHEAISKEFIIKIVDKDSNKDGYHDQDVEVLKNILINNNAEGKLDWEGTDYLSYSGITWNDNTPKRITEINLSDKSLDGDLKIGSCTELTDLSCNSNSIDNLDISNCSLLTKLYCQENNISKIDVSNLSLLTRLNCSRNKISELDIYNCSLLTTLYCTNNQISKLDVYNCSLLTTLYCKNNQISKLDVSNCTLLTILTCYNNNISTLDISNCTRLTSLDCYINNISTLDISNCTRLTELDCYSNKLSFSELSKINVDGFNYHSNKKIFEEKEYCTTPQTIDFSSEEIINGEKSDFKWFKDGKLLKGINSSRYTASDLGNYYCSITNSEFPNLTLVTNTIRIQKNEYTPSFSDQEFVLIKGNKNGSIIGSVIINDKDSPKNIIHYEIDNNNFIIDEKTGEIIIRDASSIDYENANTLKIIITINDNKHEAISKEFIINIVDKDSNKDGYHDQDVEVLKNILKNNNTEGKLDWEGTDYSSYSGITWNNNNPKRITEIDIMYKFLNGYLKLSSCTKLTYLNCNNNYNISELDITDCSLLTEISCYGNKISDLNISNSPLLTTLDCANNKISDLDTSNCPLLTSLNCYNNKIKEINISNFPLLKSLICNNNNISILDASNCTLLTSLNCNNNKISDLNISNCTLLTTLSCENNKISDFNISNCTLLTTLSCENNKISDLNISNCALLTTLSCYNNKISDLNISNCALLTTLSCYNNKISDLDASNSPLLKSLTCNNNNISILNASNCTLLTTLSCYNNKISELDTSNSPLLKSLNCFNNNISKIDISNCTQLKDVYINSNKLSFSELSKIKTDQSNYQSSKKVFEEKEYFTIPQTIDLSSEAIINWKISDFKWFKDGKLLEGKNSSRYTASDFGNYYCSITNSEFPDLTLVTNTIKIQKNEYVPSFSDQEFILIKGNKSGTIIGSVIINDKDSPKNLIHYEIKENNNFIIDEKTGEITIIDASSIDYENASTIKVTITINDNKHEAISKEFTIKMVDKDSNKDGYHDEDVEVLKNILENNNAEGKLDWEGTDYSSYSGITWNDNTPKRITGIKIYNKSLIGDLDVSNCSVLTLLNCNNNNIDNLNFSNCILLTELYCSNNKISNLDVSNCSLLTRLYCKDNQVSELDISNCSLLTILYCTNNKISKLDVSNCSLLTSLNCSDNKIIDLDVSNCSLLTTLNYDNNIISEIDISNCSLLTTLSCSDNKIIDLDISNCSLLTHLDCSDNKIGELNISNCVLLEELECYDNKISELDLSKCSLLINLDCKSNKLKTIEIQNCTKLIILKCKDNNLVFSQFIKDIPRMSYYPQNKVFEEKTYYTFPQILDYSSEEIINGIASEYKWYKNGKLIEEANSSIYSAITPGNYYCKITNTVFSDLILTTNTVRLQINDNAPTFSDQEFELAEGYKIGTIIGQVEINDIDKPRNPVKYKIEDNTHISINPKTGEITLTDLFYPTNKIYIDITINDNKHDDVSKRFTINIVDRDINKDGYHDNDVEVLKNILENNNSRGKIDWQGTDYSTYKGIVWDDNTPRQIIDIKLDFKDLDGDLNISDCNKLVNIDFASNYLNSINISGCNQLYEISCRDGDIKNLHISNCYKLTYTSCDNNELYNIDISDCPSLRGLSIRDNYFSFSELYKLKKYGLSNYTAQHKLYKKRDHYINTIIDFSSEENIGSTKTVFRWYKDNELIDNEHNSSLTPTEFGVYYCKMTNTEFPNLELTTNDITIIETNKYQTYIPRNQKFYLDENTTEVISLGFVKIYDKDYIKDKVTFNTESKIFDIDKDTGELFYNSEIKINYEETESISIEVTVKDGKNRFDREKVIIYVNDINEAPSNILLSNNMILRDSEKGCLIGTLSTQDEDKNDIISYDILENKHFELDNNNLILKLKLNFDDTKIYKILVSAVDKEGLACTQVLEIIEDTTTGIIELKNIETKLYPNPVEDNLNIQISGLENKDVHISIYSLNGEALFKQKYQVENGQLIEEINMHNFSSGTYLMMLVQNNKIKSYKIIKL